MKWSVLFLRNQKTKGITVQTCKNHITTKNTVRWTHSTHFCYYKKKGSLLISIYYTLPISLQKRVPERLRNMACVRFYLCVMLILLSFAQSETRPLDPSAVRRNLIRTIRALGETETYNVKQGNEGMIGGRFSSKRVSPGGPDAQHHW
jgi:hypothetical protein